MTPREKVKKDIGKLRDKVHDRNMISHEGVPIELPSNDRLKEIRDKHFNVNKRKRSTNYKDALQGDIDKIVKKIKVD